MMRSAPWRLTVVFFAGLATLGVLTSAFAFVTPRIKPPAPGPTYLSQADHDQLLAIHAAVKKKQFPAARAKAARVADPIAKSLGEWMYFMGEDPLVNIKAADAFLDAHPGWPATRRIQSFVEKRIRNNTPANDVLALFQSRDPATGDGKIQLARAHYEKGAKDAGDRYLRDAWINHNFRVSQERKILSSYGGRLSKEDHAARVDRLLWARQITNARRIFSRLTSAKRREAEARAALLLGASSGPGLYKKLSKDQQLDSGMLHAAVRHYRRAGDEPYAIALAATSPKDPSALRNSGRWWDERQLLMRWALREGRFGDAYTAAAHHGLEPGGDYAEAEFNAGWIALRFMNEPKRAEAHFLALASAVGTPISNSRAYYWLGRSAAARNDANLATIYYGAAAKHYYSYYGQLAAEELGGDALTKKFAAPATSTAEDRALFSSRPTVAALRKLSDLNLDYEFMVFAYHVDDQLTRPGEFIELAKLTNGEGAPHLTVRAGKVAIQKNAFAPDVAYPVVFVPDEAARFISPEIVLGLSRQESEFNPRAFSHAGARGLMQLIPTTAQLTARKEGLRYSRSALLDDPVYNMTLGSAHLSHLVNRFDGSLIMTFASYNAGQSRVTRWMREYGDPRDAAIDPVDWVELIPFSETRNYVQRVLENTQVYRGRLNNAPIPGRLSADLERGGPKKRAATAPKPAIIKVNAASKPLAPLPARTAKRAEEFALVAMARLSPQPLSQPLELQPANADEKPTTTRRNRRSRRARRATVIADAKPQAPAEEATTTRAQPDSIAAIILAAGNTVVTSNAGVVAVTETAPAMPTVKPEQQLPAPVATASATTAKTSPGPVAAAPPVITKSLPDPVVTPVAAAPVVAAETAPADAQPLFPPVITSIQTDVAMRTAANDVVGETDIAEAAASAVQEINTAPPNYVQAPGDGMLAILASALADPTDEAEETVISDPVVTVEPGSAEWCSAYREFLLRNAEGQANAADLNAVMLADLQGKGCS